MDKLTMRLRYLMQGQIIEYQDVYFGRKETFLVTDIQTDESGYTVIQGKDPFQRIYVPVTVIPSFIENGSCIYHRQYNTQDLEYRIRICSE